MMEETAFEVIDSYYNDWDYAIIVHEPSYYWAALEAAEEIDNHAGEGPSERTLFVRKKGKDVFKQFRITFEYSVDYHAKEVNWK